VALWAKVRHLDHDTAHRLSRRIVDLAQAAGAVILVFEHLGPFRPERGKYSRRANAKRSSWLRGKLIHFARYQAGNAGILTCRVNPKNTSRLCARCGAAVVRDAVGQPREGEQPGAPLVGCPRWQQTVHAACTASRALGQRLVVRCTPAPQEKPPTRLATGEAPTGAGVRPAHAAAGPGSANRHGTA
jgi:putative transposase